MFIRPSLHQSSPTSETDTCWPAHLPLMVAENVTHHEKKERKYFRRLSPVVFCYRNRCTTQLARPDKKNISPWCEEHHKEVVCLEDLIEVAIDEDNGRVYLARCIFSLTIHSNYEQNNKRKQLKIHLWLFKYCKYCRIPLYELDVSLIIENARKCMNLLNLHLWNLAKWCHEVGRFDLSSAELRSELNFVNKTVYRNVKLSLTDDCD